MHRVLCQQKAKQRIRCTWWHGSDHVARVDVLDGGLHVLGRKVAGDAILDEGTDGRQRAVATGIACGGGALLAQQVLARALGKHHDGVPLGVQHALQVREAAALAVQLNGHLGDEAQIGILAGQRGVRRDEACMAPHELHDADAVRSAGGFDLGGPDGGLRLFDGRVEAEGAVDEVDVVVDGFGDAGHAELQLVVARGKVQLLRSPMGAVASDDVELVHPVALQPGEDAAAVEPAARGAQHSAAFVVDALHRGGRKQDGLLAGCHAHVAVADAEHGGHAVEVVKRVDQFTHDVVDAGAEAAAGHDRGSHLAWVPVEMGARSSTDVGHRFGRLLGAAHDVGQDVVRVILEVAIGDELLQRIRREPMRVH
mmetsp:Transcript_9312/g.29375  ORF Transcript_9312/g.29375 Transcript_9312/m.29375 type:complete len:368 (+) Transcript_9312:423-1526(+)